MERDASRSKSSPTRSSLTEHEEQEVVSRASPRAVVVHEAIRKEGEEEIARPAQSLAWSGLAAGLAMGISLMAEGLIRAGLPDAPWRDLVAGFGYTIGFLVVILGRQQLFTENTVTAVLPFLHAQNRGTFAAVTRLWGIVLVTNIVGTLLFAAGAGLTSAFDEEARRAFLEIGQHAAEPGFWTTFTRAIVAGWLIALMVWLLPAAGSARFLVIVTVTYLVAVADLAHVIAGSTEVAYAAFAGAVSWTEYAIGFIVPALIGNILGGVVFVAVLNHAQVEQEL